MKTPFEQSSEFKKKASSLLANDFIIMPTTSLQDQYPLSSRKFWKKIIEKTPLWLALFAGLGVFFVLGVGMFMYGNVDGALERWKTLAFASMLTWVVSIAMYAVYVKIYIRQYYYDANESFVTIKKGVFAPTEIHVQYQKIQDVYVDQDILDRIMGLYDVHIASATISSGIEAHIDGVNFASSEGLKHLLLDKIQVACPTPTQQETLMQPVPSTQLSEEVSIDTYPIVGRWVVQKAIGSLFLALVYAGMATMYLVIPDNDSNKSMADIFGMGGVGVSGFFIVVYILSFILQFAYAILWRMTYFFEFLPEYIVMRSGVIARREVHLPYRVVQNVTVSQGFIELILGIATVVVENAAAPEIISNSIGGRIRALSRGLRIPGQPLSKANRINEIVKSVTIAKNQSQTGL